MPVDGVEYRWPAFFPANCPPPDAVAIVRVVHRFVDHDPPTAADFEPVLLSGRGFTPERTCDAAGLSVFSDPVHAGNYRRRYKGFRRRRLARGTIQKHHGLTKDTPSEICPSHVTWWVPEGIAAEAMFTVILES